MPTAPELLKLTKMVDIHCHILPETDDGATSMDESVAMCRAAAADGIKTIIATPHMFDGVHTTPEKDAIRRKIKLVLEAAGNCIEIVPGGEVRYSYEIFQEADDPDTRIKLNGTSYMLLEFPFQSIPPNIEKTIFQILNAGITPVIAHPNATSAFRKIRKSLPIWSNAEPLPNWTQAASPKALGRNPINRPRRYWKQAWDISSLPTRTIRIGGARFCRQQQQSRRSGSAKITPAPWSKKIRKPW